MKPGVKKIGIFMGYFLPFLGGIERYVDKLSTALSKLGYEIVIVTSKHDNLPSYEKQKSRVIYRLPIHNVFKSRYPIPKRNAEFKALIRQIENEHIDYFLLNTRFHLTSLIGGRMGKRSGRPVVLIEHGTGHFSVGNKVLDFFGGIYEHLLTSVVKKYVDKFYGVSQKCSEWMGHFGIVASGVFYNAINVADANKVKNYYQKKYSKDEVVVVYAGRLIKEKGALNLAEAFADLRTTTKARLVIAGDGPLMDDIKAIQQRHDNIEAIGKLDFDHIMALYKRADILVNPSLFPEGLPTSILEAGLMGCAIIATPKGGTQEVIVDGQHGIIIDGSKESLREALTLLIDDPATRKLQAKKVQARIKKQFEWTVVAKKVDTEIKGFKK